MRRILLALIVAAGGVLMLAANAGCEDNVLTSNARSGLSSFLTGVLSEAINTSSD